MPRSSARHRARGRGVWVAQLRVLELHVYEFVLTNRTLRLLDTYGPALLDLRSASHMQPLSG